MRRALSYDALTIGFARRFATYKRANLLMEDMDALVSLVNHPQMPVQIIFAGKSHPHDRPGKEVLQRIAELIRDPRFVGKVMFIEDYDISLGRQLVHGVDVWMNNPRRPLEACGTSGQKVVLNGGLNLSVIDGWWAEAYDGLNGFSIGTGDLSTAEYKKLSEGTYHFQVAAADIFGNPTGPPLTLGITVPPPFWRSPWFWSLSGFSAAALVLGAWRYIAWRRTRLELLLLRGERALE